MHGDRHGCDTVGSPLLVVDIIRCHCHWVLASLVCHHHSGDTVPCALTTTWAQAQSAPHCHHAISKLLTVFCPPPGLPPARPGNTELSGAVTIMCHQDGDVVVYSAATRGDRV